MLHVRLAFSSSESSRKFGRTVHGWIQNDSGLAQGLAGWHAAGCAWVNQAS